MVVAEPEIAFVPDHAPDAEQLVALVLLHASFEVAPAWIDVGEAVNVTVGAVAPIVTVAVRAIEPPAPLHVSV